MSDRNFRSFADVTGLHLQDERFDPRHSDESPKSYADVLKFSHARDVIARCIWVAGGGENAIDMNRGCLNVTIEDSTLEGGGQCALVVKGGSQDITLRRLLLTAITSAYDIEIGGWSDQCYLPTTSVRLVDVTRADGKPVRVVVGRADWPAVVGGNVKILRVQSYLLKAFWWAKYFVVSTILRRKPLITELSHELSQA